MGDYWMLKLSGLLGTAGVFAEIVIPTDTWVERLGTAGLLVAGAYLMLTYFMRALEKKDALIEKMTAENTAAITSHLKEGHKVQADVAAALNGLRRALEEGRLGK